MYVRNLFVSIALLLLLAGCATPYQTFELFGRGGYQETKLSDDAYQVAYYGNHVTPFETINSLLLYRTAVLTVENGFDYFEVQGGYRRTPLSVYGGFRILEHTVKMRKGEPENKSDHIYVARKIIQEFAPHVDKQK